MSSTSRPSFDTWSEFLAAVEHVAAVERPDSGPWDALAEALAVWSDDGSARPSVSFGEDVLRSVLRRIMDTTAEHGAPGGLRIDAILDAAMSTWIESATSRVNDGQPFRR
jgi:hypothetical protein